MSFYVQISLPKWCPRSWKRPYVAMTIYMTILLNCDQLSVSVCSIWRKRVFRLALKANLLILCTQMNGCAAYRSLILRLYRMIYLITWLVIDKTALQLACLVFSRASNVLRVSVKRVKCCIDRIPFILSLLEKSLF